MTDLIGKKVLVTCQSWFYGPDGKTYRAVWGTLNAVHEAGKTLGFIPNRSHANWYLSIGSLTVMGCQVMYILECINEPPSGSIYDYTTEGGVLKEFVRPSQILILND